MNARGRVAVATDSWHWRWYMEWRLNKGSAKTQRAQVDLCHYMRVLLIFGPWRWFWQGELAFQLPAFLYVLLLAALGGIVILFVAFTGPMVAILEYIGLALVLAAAFFAIGYGFRRWYIKDTAAADAKLERIADVIWRVGRFVFFPIWFPIYWLVRGVKAAGLAVGHVIYRGGDWFFTKRLFALSIFDELVTFSPAGVVLPLWALALVVLEFVLHPIGALIVTGIIVAAIVLAVGVVLLGKRIQRWSREHPPESDGRPPKPKKEHETARLVWSWVVSKKHRVCPLIEVKQ